MTRPMSKRKTRNYPNHLRRKVCFEPCVECVSEPICFDSVTVGGVVKPVKLV